MNIEAKTIPYKDQRYETCGDYYWRQQYICSLCSLVLTANGTVDGIECPRCHNAMEGVTSLHFRINEMDSEDYEFLVLIHEMIEEHLTRRRGLKEPEIMAFDVMWEKEREEGKHSEDDEPGHDPRAPYNKEHVLAENIERLLAHSMDVDWNAYAKAVIDSCAVTMTT